MNHYLPFIPLIGKKVRLDLFELSDITDEYIAWLNDPIVTRYSNQRFKVHTRESCLSYFHGFSDSSNLFLSIYDQLENKSIGTMTAYYSIYHQHVDVGIMLGDTSYWGKAYASEAWNLLIDFLLQQDVVHKVTAGTLSCNLPMIKLINSSGFLLEGIRKEQEIQGNQFYDINLYAKFKHGDALN